MIERISLVFRLFFEYIKDKILIVENLKKIMILSLIILSLIFIMMIDNKVSGTLLKDGDVTITTMIETPSLLEEKVYNVDNYDNEESTDVTNDENVYKNEYDYQINQNQNQSETNAKTKTYEIVNINIANLDKLTTLPGIGESTAKKIIEYRENNGDFKNISDLKKVSGIGDKKYKKLEKYIEV